MKQLTRRHQAHEVFDMVKFIVDENYNHHVSGSGHQQYASEINSVYDEELTYCQNSKIFVEKDSDGSILGTIRILQWNFIDPLPLQKIFKINPLDHVDLGQVNDVFHFGRLAIRKNYPSLKLFKRLIAAAIDPVCENRHNVAFAECDSKLFKTLTLLGIRMDVIGKPIKYLGSETIPVKISYDGLIGFHLKQQHNQKPRIMHYGVEKYGPQIAFGI